ncbi:hypothetical protein A2U01_0114858, partial [Trifolium medium]|nr:hypothetical protein [Trifolium medium]
LANLETLKAEIELEKKDIAEEAEIELESLKAEIELEIAKEAEIELENKDIAEAQKHTTKVSKQQVKRP